MKKYKNLLIPVMLLLTFSLSSCNFFDIFNKDINDDYSYPEEESEVIPPDAGYYRADYSEYTYHDIGQKSLYGSRFQNSLGEQKTLVVPVIIAGYERNATEENRKKIEKAFFGKPSETGWESVSSYYEKSSYGHLKITGTVTDWFNTGLTVAEMHQYQYGNLSDGGTIKLTNLARNFAIKQGLDMRDYDLNNDGFIDSMCLIYSAPNKTNGKYSASHADTMWAFTYWDYSSIEKPDKNNPVPNTYLWASYDFMFDGKSVGIDIDAHTYIHEFGHVLGLDDYYDYDGLHAPLGCVDMQDYNVGDHNAFSKYAFGWIRPYVVTDSCEITIKPSSIHPHAILLKNPNVTWNNSAFDEYILIELITPELLWKQDSSHKYPSILTYAYTTPGVRILHVDARLMNSREKIVSEMSGNELFTTAYSNTPSRSYSRGTSSLREDLLALIPQNHDRDFQTKPLKIATNDVLFKTGDTFSVSNYCEFFNSSTLHNGSKIPFNVTFKSVSKDSATIQFERV